MHVHNTFRLKYRACVKQASLFQSSSLFILLANISSNASWIFVMIGIFASSTNFLLLGIILLAAGVVFQLVTLPV
ncbi:zinc metallopeptidase, partial [Klebsiella pneumoniae]|uniref:zinc metallopeptidase n=1 Tax=Klebsiella pneumoniae TaxID=573 RepID=UPI001D0D8F56